MRRQHSKAEILSRLRSECRDLQAQLYQSRVGIEASSYLNEQQNNNLDVLQNLLVNGRERLQQILHNQGNISSFNFEKEKVELVYYLQWLLACTIQSDMVSMIRRFPAPATLPSTINSSGSVISEEDTTPSRMDNPKMPVPGHTVDQPASFTPSTMLPNLAIAKHPEAAPNSAVVVSSALVMNEDIMANPRPLPDLVDKLINLVINCVTSSQAVERASNQRRDEFQERQQYLLQLTAEVAELRRKKSLREANRNESNLNEAGSICQPNELYENNHTVGASHHPAPSQEHQAQISVFSAVRPQNTSSQASPSQRFRSEEPQTQSHQSQSSRSQRLRRQQPPQLQLVDRHEIRRFQTEPLPEQHQPSQELQELERQEQQQLRQLQEARQLQKLQPQQLEEFQQLQLQQLHDLRQFQQMQPQQHEELHQLQQLQLQQLQQHQLQEFQHPQQIPEFPERQQFQHQQLPLEQFQEFQQLHEFQETQQSLSSQPLPQPSTQYSDSSQYLESSQPSEGHTVPEVRHWPLFSELQELDSQPPNHTLPQQQHPEPPNDPNIDMVIDSWLDIATPSSNLFTCN